MLYLLLLALSFAPTSQAQSLNPYANVNLLDVPTGQPRTATIWGISNTDSNQDQAALSVMRSQHLETASWNDPSRCTMPDGSEQKIRQVLGPIRNQKHRGDCFANVAADLGTVATGHYLSAFHIDTMFNANTRLRITARRHHSAKTVGNYTLFMMNSVSMAPAMRKQFRQKKFHSLKSPDLDTKLMAIAKDAKAGSCSNESANALSRVLGVSHRDSVNLLSTVKGMTSDNFLLAMLDRVCKNSYKPNQKSAYAMANPMDPKSPQNRLAVWTAISALQTGHPAGLAINVTDLLPPGHDIKASYDHAVAQMKKDGDHPTCEDSADLKDATEEVKAGMAGHALTIVGMHFDPAKKQCMISLRNSWGSKSCTLKSDGKCRDGVLEITADHLQKDVLGVLIAR